MRVRQTNHYWKLLWYRDIFPQEWDQKTGEIIGDKKRDISIDQRKIMKKKEVGLEGYL